jgi:hypothetical protein
MLKIFIGTSPNQDDELAEKVLEYSLRKHSSEPLEIIFMRNNSDPSNFFGGFDDSTWWTPFSHLRWFIPEYCDFKGRALYMDVDQINFKDITELFHMDLKGKAVALREGDSRSCVMLLDCEKLKGRIESSANVKKNPLTSHPYFVNDILKDCTYYDKRWNCLDGEDRRSSDIWHLHFTEMTTQPWSPKWAHNTWQKKGKVFKKSTHPRGDLVYIWNYFLKEATNV